MLAMIACMTVDGVIGKNGKLPWSCSDDMQRFKRLTMGNAVIMGRKTAESLKGPLPGRTNYVVSQNEQAEGFVQLVPGMLHHKLLGFHQALYPIWIIGGSQLYTEAMEYCDLLHLTVLHDDYEGDTFFPVGLRDALFVEKERIAFADGVFTTWYRK